MKIQNSKFELGQVVITPAVLGLIETDSNTKSFDQLLTRHSDGDWGIVSTQDALQNDRAIKDGSMTLSAYQINNQTIWIITDAGRKCTTILLPSEY
jgi:hypothetical protein